MNSKAKKYKCTTILFLFFKDWAKIKGKVLKRSFTRLSIGAIPSTLGGEHSPLNTINPFMSSLRALRALSVCVPLRKLCATDAPYSPLILFIRRLRNYGSTASRDPQVGASPRSRDCRVAARYSTFTELCQVRPRPQATGALELQCGRRIMNCRRQGRWRRRRTATAGGGEGKEHWADDQDDITSIIDDNAGRVYPIILLLSRFADNRRRL